MKYLGILFVFLLAFTVFIVFTVIAEGDIDGILTGLTENDEEINVFKNYLVKENEFDDIEIPEIVEYSKTPEEEIYEETQIFVSVLSAKTNEVSTAELEEYLCGVVFSEMPSSFELEALKAQAVAARSFCAYKMLYSTDEARAEHLGADICNDYRHCKDYIRYADACEKYGEENIKSLWEKIQSAVYATKGEIITYKSEPAIAVFHAMSGKETESAENVWGNAVPYLVSVPSMEEIHKSEIKNYVTEQIFSEEEFKEILISNGLRLDFSEYSDASSWVSNLLLNSSGRVDTVGICGKPTTGRRLREIFSLRSTDFILEYKNQAFIFTVTGYGHGVGLSQYGANLMAREGKNYIEILQWYYTGVEINKAGDFF